MDQEIQQLKSKVAGLIQWKKERDQQQLTYPIDETSQKELYKDLIVVEKREKLSSGSIYYVKINGKGQGIWVGNPLYSFNVDVASDLILMPKHSFIDDQKIWLLTTGTAPAGLSTSIPYRVTNTTTNNFQLRTLGSEDIVDITGEGTGIHYFEED